ncbi:MAG: hypothetical protein Q9198_009867, partial [Flavoplaca austrocitrina]
CINNLTFLSSPSIPLRTQYPILNQISPSKNKALYKTPRIVVKTMPISWVPPSFRRNTNGSVRSENSRRDNTHPICSPHNLLLPFSRLFHTRIWPRSKKSRKRRQWIKEIKARRNRPIKPQTPYPDTNTNPIPLKARTQETEEISLLNPGDRKTIGLGDNGLGRLPPELRHQIYKLIFSASSNVLILQPSQKIIAVPETRSVHHWLMAGQGYPPRFLNHYDDNREAKFCANRPAILRTCRQIYIEAVELLYSENTFVFKDAAIFAAFTEAVGRRRLDAIRKLRVVFCEASWPAQADVKMNLGRQQQQGQTMEKSSTRAFPPPYQLATPTKFVNDANGTGAGRP